MLIFAADICPVLGTTIDNGKVNATATNEYGSVVRYDCDEGYQVDDGVPLTFCQGNQTWKDADVPTTCTGKLYQI